MDLYRMRVRNGWILCALFTGACLGAMEGGGGIREYAMGAVLPAAVLGWLFYFRMMGAGDVKLFCALGCIMGPEAVLYCIGLSFFWGALISLAILILCSGLGERIQYLLEYLEGCLRKECRRPYYRKGDAWENFHFTVPIFMSVMFYAGGMY